MRLSPAVTTRGTMRTRMADAGADVHHTQPNAHQCKQLTLHASRPTLQGPVLGLAANTGVRLRVGSARHGGGQQAAECRRHGGLAQADLSSPERNHQR